MRGEKNNPNYMHKSSANENTSFLRAGLNVKNVKANQSLNSCCGNALVQFA